MSKSGNESSELIAEIRREKASGKIVKRFKDDYFALDLLKILYDDTVDVNTKVELLIALEEYGHLGITEDRLSLHLLATSVDQIVTALLDIHHLIIDKGDKWAVNCHILTTCTSLIIQFEQLNSELNETIVKELVTIVTSRVNQPDSQRLRACACQCLMHLEEFYPGLLFCYHDDISQLSRQERSHVFQDYALLAAKILESVPSASDQNTDSGTHLKVPGLQKQMSYEPQDIRQTAAYIVENLPLFTRSGTLRVIQSLTKLAKQLPQVSPMIFKPTMLHQMATMSCVVFHTVLYLQKEFENEVLSAGEEVDLLQRLCIMCDHPSLNHLHRLLVIQWAQGYSMDRSGSVYVHKSIVMNQRSRFYPSVFDSVDCQLGKLCMTSLLGDTSNDTEGVETSILLGSLGCLHKIVWHTGSGTAARALFKALYYIYTKHNNTKFAKDIQRFVRGLISEFAHFIPHSIDFADSVYEIASDDQVFVDTLRLLHQQVVMATEEQIYHSYQFYLQIMKKAASRKEIDQRPALKFLSYLVKNASSINDSGWKLGHGILDICRTIIMSHGTEFCFLDNQGVLERRTQVNNDFSTYSFIITAAFVLPAITLLGNALKQNYGTKGKVSPHQFTYFSWLLVISLLSCVLDVMNLFDNVTEAKEEEKFGQSCYYIYVLKCTFVSFTGLCLVALLVEHLITALTRSGNIGTNKDKKFQTHIVCLSLLCVSFILSNMAQFTFSVNFRQIKKCWKGNAYEGHAAIAALYDLILYLINLTASLILILVNGLVFRWKSRSQLTVLVPACMVEADQPESSNIDRDIMTSGNVTHLEIQAQVQESSSSNGVQADMECFELKELVSKRRRSSEGGHLKSSRSIHGNKVYLRHPTTMHSARKRFKSDSEIQKARIGSSRKGLDEQVLEALEQFFVVDTSRVLLRALHPNQEMSKILMDDNDDNIFDDDDRSDVETNFDNGFEDNKLAHRKLIRMGVGKRKHLSFSDAVGKLHKGSRFNRSTGSSRRKVLGMQLSDPGGRKKGEQNHSTSSEVYNNALFCSDDVLEFSFKEAQREVVADVPVSSTTVEVSTNKIECPKIVVSNSEAFLSEECESLSSESPEVEEDENRLGLSFARSEGHNVAQTVNDKGGVKSSIEQTNAEMGVGNMDTIEVDIVVNAESAVRTEQEEISRVDDDDSKDKNTVHVDTTNVEIESMEYDNSNAKEKLAFKEYYKKFLLKSFKDFICLIVAYMICLIPQVVLDVYRLMLNEQSTVSDRTDGVLAVVSDAAVSMYFICVSVIYIWSLRKRRVIKSNI